MEQLFDQWKDVKTQPVHFQGEWVYEWFLNGIRAHKKDKIFALVWTNKWTHNDLNPAGDADQPTVDLLQAMHAGKRTILLMLFCDNYNKFDNPKWIKTWQNWYRVTDVKYS